MACQHLCSVSRFGRATEETRDTGQGDQNLEYMIEIV